MRRKCRVSPSYIRLHQWRRAHVGPQDVLYYHSWYTPFFVSANHMPKWAGSDQSRVSRHERCRVVFPRTCYCQYPWLTEVCCGTIPLSSRPCDKSLEKKKPHWRGHVKIVGWRQLRRVTYKKEHYYYYYFLLILYWYYMIVAIHLLLFFIYLPKVCALQQNLQVPHVSQTWVFRGLHVSS